MALEKMYTFAAAEEATGIPVATWRDWRRRRLFKAARPGKRVLICESELRRLLGLDECKPTTKRSTRRRTKGKRK